MEMMHANGGEVVDRRGQSIRRLRLMQRLIMIAEHLRNIGNRGAAKNVSSRVSEEGNRHDVWPGND